ncbi:hypothetical protein LTR96_011188 [Exophiala xenobiotica]|nr:hypothetical protein LTR47_010832 [Exophiala xenobiotica]KAK5263398.1 hypothetical protein LTR96_011188 [Exophiala xenobiotica]KAK5345261.1 hypothetical protein LTR61_010982 [Exophiala xenobiotica]KAK5359983.1 hypothetical protein LTS03_010811 [Exophiala xenobiotica]KAK5433197.1 hypothetical protein LTR18_010991 [Exophiala xenobiotica]
MKDIEFNVSLGSSTWSTFAEANDEIELMTSSFHKSPCRLKHLRRLVLAWSYALSCRWAEIVQASGQEVAVLHRANWSSEEEFWKMIKDESWQVHFTHENQVYYSPFMIKSEGWTTSYRYAIATFTLFLCDSNKYHSLSTKPALANFSKVFDLLLRFCARHLLLPEFFVAMTIAVLSPPTFRRPVPKLMPWIPTTALEITTSGGTVPPAAYEVFDRIDQILMLGSIIEGTDSFLSEASFDLSLPCNILGAQYVAMFSALDIDNEGNGDRFLTAIYTLFPHLTLFWYAAAACGQAREMMDEIFSLGPPVCIPLAVWTHSVQTAWQVSYVSDNGEDGISRAKEFSLLFLTRPEIIQPLPRAPPFGKTPIRNLSLALREHLSHDHRFSSAKFYERLQNNGLREMGKEWTGGTKSVRLQTFVGETTNDAVFSSYRNNWLSAFEISSNATRYLYAWYSRYEDGMWLDEGNGKSSEEIRNLNKHPWMQNLFEEESEGRNSHESPERTLGQPVIARWRDEVVREQDIPLTLSINGSSERDT